VAQPEEFMRDPYKVLGVAKTASQEDLKKAYRKLAKQLHPDKNPNDAKAAERFKEVSAAYAIVGDEDTRKKFDRGEIDANGNERAAGFGGGGFNPGGFGGAGRQQGPWGARGPRPEMFEEFGIGEDLFADLFGERRGGRAGGGAQFRRKGADRNYALTVDFLDAARGTRRRITLPDGKSLDVNIPAGIQDGQQIRLRGQGEAGQGGEAGDGLIEVTVSPHPFFERKGNDIHVELPVTLREAVLGGKVNAPTVGGMVSLTIPKSASSGTTLRLKGKGIHPKGADAAGDQFVKLKIVLPKKLDPAVEKAVEAMGDDSDVRSGFSVS
jgi:DnaJ-class molecular chaperone